MSPSSPLLLPSKLAATALEANEYEPRALPLRARSLRQPFQIESNQTNGRDTAAGSLGLAVGRPAPQGASQDHRHAGHAKRSLFRQRPRLRFPRRRAARAEGQGRAGARRPPLLTRGVVTGRGGNAMLRPSTRAAASRTEAPARRAGSAAEAGARDTTARLPRACQPAAPSPRPRACACVRALALPPRARGNGTTNKAALFPLWPSRGCTKRVRELA
ncbi:hypothetical protein PVAP13_6NG274903 [Panicum virgatum]|uniref:Uncharacterized protein n=1 Tax=Panicum virgatum TaxID=38727 RepID=A0A8T0R164_PANVG|nr:hypothetical protein PVAP13_6NG274903 [Panicum virgatum]